MKIGFLKTDVKVGGLYHDLFYDNVVVEDRKVENISGYLAVEANEGEINYAWLVAHKDNIKWENLAIYVEMPVAFKTANAPAWLDNNTYTDENGDVQTHTLESYADGPVRNDNLAGTMWVFKVTASKDLTLAQLNQLETFLGNNATATAMLVKETRDLLNGPNYTAE